MEILPCPGGDGGRSLAKPWAYRTGFTGRAVGNLGGRSSFQFSRGDLNETWDIACGGSRAGAELLSVGPNVGPS